MKKKAVYILVLIGIILALVSFIYDTEIVRFIENLRYFSLDYFLISISFAGQAIIVFFFLTSLFLWKEHKRRWIFPLWLTLASSAIISYIIKVLIHRPRPFQEGIVSVLGMGVYLLKESFLTWNFSFPSFESMLVFAALPILDKEFPKFKYFWFAFACFVAFSRVYFGMHYMSDVISGIVIGYLLGLLFVFVEERYSLGTKVMKKLKIKK